jgi:putative nucleotidyltransferase with HDIG domain
MGPIMEPNAPSSETLPIVVVVDDDPGILRAVERTLRRSQVDIMLANGPTEAMSILEQHQVAVVISDYMMPGMDGLEMLSLIRKRWPEIVGIMMTACEDIRVAADAVNRHLVNSFITKPWETAALRQSILEAVEAHQKRLESTDEIDQNLGAEIQQQATAAAFSLARAVDARDPYTHRHSEKVAAYAQVVGRAMHLPEDTIEDIRIGGLLHDLGKIGVSDGILLKPNRLTDEEYQIIKRHPTIGASIVEPINFSETIQQIIRHHHENHNGTGYPDGLKEDQIDLPARIVHVVDAFEAMSANRVYRGARDLDWIVEEFNRCSGTQFNPEIIQVFLEELQKGTITDSVKHLLN